MMLIILFVAMFLIMFALEGQSEKRHDRARRRKFLRYYQIRLKNMGNFTEKPCFPLRKL